MENLLLGYDTESFLLGFLAGLILCLLLSLVMLYFSKENGMNGGSEFKSGYGSMDDDEIEWHG